MSAHGVPFQMTLENMASRSDRFGMESADSSRRVMSGVIRLQLHPIVIAVSILSPVRIHICRNVRDEVRAPATVSGVL